MNTLIQLHEKMAEVCPIHGIDSTGRIDFKDEATPAQRAAAEALVKQWQEGKLTLPEIEDASPKALLARIKALEAEIAKGRFS